MDETETEEETLEPVIEESAADFWTVFEAAHFSRYAVILITKLKSSAGSFDLSAHLKQTKLMTGNPLQEIPENGQVSLSDKFSLWFYFDTLTAEQTDLIEEGKT